MRGLGRHLEHLLDSVVGEAEQAAAEPGIAATLLAHRLLEDDDPLGAALARRGSRSERRVTRAHHHDVPLARLHLAAPPAYRSRRPLTPAGKGLTPICACASLQPI